MDAMLRLSPFGEIAVPHGLDYLLIGEKCQQHSQAQRLPTEPHDLCVHRYTCSVETARSIGSTRRWLAIPARTVLGTSGSSLANKSSIRNHDAREQPTDGSVWA